MAGNQNLVAQIIINAKDNASAAFDGIRENAGKLAAALATVLSVDFFKSSVDSAADFEEQLTITGVKAGATSEDLQKLKTAAIEIGNEFGATGTEALKGLEIIASAGYKTEESISLLSPAFVLADNSGKSLAESAGYLIKIMQSLGLETSSAADVTDILTIASNQANTKVGDLTEAMLGSGGTAKTFGYDIKDTAAMLDVLAGSGKSGADAGVALRNILLQISDPSSKASKGFQDLGINSTNLVEIFKALSEKGQAGKDALLNLNSADIAAANGILANIDKYDKLRAGLEGIGGAGKKASDDLGENFKAASSDLSALWENLKTKLGTPILEPLKNAVVGVQEKIKELTDSGIIDKIGQSLAEAFKIASMATGEFVKTVDFTTIGEKIKNFTVATIQTFQEINTGVQATANFFSLFSNTVSTVFNGLQAGAAILEAAVTATFGGMNKIIGQVATGWGEIFLLMPGFEKLGSSLKGMGDYMTQSGNAAIDFAKALKDNAGKQLDEAGIAANKVQTAFTALANSAKDSVPKLDSIWQVSNTISDALNGTKTATNNAAQANQNLANSTKETATAVDTTAQKVNAHTSAIYHYVDAMGQSHFADKQNAEGKNAVAVAIDGVKSKTDNLAGSITAIPDKESKITADATQAKNEIEQLKTPTASQHTVESDANKAAQDKENLQTPTGSLHTIDSNAQKPAQDINVIKQDTKSTHTFDSKADKPEEEIKKLTTDTVSVHTFGSNAIAVTKDREEIQKDTISLHTFGSNSESPRNDISAITQPTSSLHTINVDNSQPASAISSNQQATSSWHTIYVQTIQTNQNGGEIQCFANGGMPQFNFQRRNGGLGGYGGGDTVPAMLEPGEYIITKEATAMYGHGFMAKLNKMQVPQNELPKYQNGGYVGAAVGVQHFEMGGEAQAVGSIGVGVSDSDINLKINIDTKAVDEAKKKLNELPTEHLTEAQIKVKAEYEGIISQNTERMQLAGDKVGLENKAFAELEAKLAGNSEALKIARANHVTKLQAILDADVADAKSAADKIAANEKAAQDKKLADEKAAQDAEKAQQDKYQSEIDAALNTRLQLAGDKVGLENLAWAKEEASLAGNAEALKIARENHNTRLKAIADADAADAKAKLDKQIADEKVAQDKKLADEKAANEAKKAAQDKYQSEIDAALNTRLQLAGDKVGLENLAWAKEEASLAGNAEALKIARENHNTRLKNIADADAADAKAAKDKQVADAKAADQQKQSQLDSLQDEFDQMEGNTLEIENRRFKKQIEGLAGNAVAQALAYKIHERKLETLKAEKERVTNVTNNNTQNSNITNQTIQQPSQVQSSSGHETISIKFQSPTHGEIAGNFNKSDAVRVVEMLKDAASRGMPATFN